MGMLGLLRGRIFGSIPLSSCVLFCIVEVQIALSCLLVLGVGWRDGGIRFSVAQLPCCGELQRLSPNFFSYIITNNQKKQPSLHYSDAVSKSTNSQKYCKTILICRNCHVCHVQYLTEDMYVVELKGWGKNSYKSSLIYQNTIRTAFWSNQLRTNHLLLPCVYSQIYGTWTTPCSHRKLNGADQIIGCAVRSKF